jgi:uncharacterized membrane protein
MDIELLQVIGFLTVESVGKAHAIFLHFPIFLFTAALVADLLHYFDNTRASTAGHWLVICAVLMCIPTIITGLAAEIGWNLEDADLIEHRFLGYATGIAGSFYAGLRISAMRWKLPLKPLHYIALSVLMVALVSWTSDYGALLSQKKNTAHPQQAVKEEVHQ